jgi:hypothetical protein
VRNNPAAKRSLSAARLDDAAEFDKHKRIKVQVVPNELSDNEDDDDSSTA